MECDYDRFDKHSALNLARPIKEIGEPGDLHPIRRMGNLERVQPCDTELVMPLATMLTTLTSGCEIAAHVATKECMVANPQIVDKISQETSGLARIGHDFLRGVPCIHRA